MNKQIVSIPIGLIEIPPRLRAVDLEYAEAIGKSIAERGQDTPIWVFPATSDGKHQVTGALQAAAIPAATAALLGGSGTAGAASAITVGSGLSLSGGTLTATGGGGYTLPQATTTVLGGVTVSTGLNVSSGALSVAYGTTGTTAAAGNDSRITGALQGAAIPSATGALLGGSGTAGAASAITVGSGLSLSSGTLTVTGTFTGGTVTGATTFSATGVALTVTNNAEFKSTVYFSGSGSTGPAITGSTSVLQLYVGATLYASMSGGVTTISAPINNASGTPYEYAGTSGVSSCSGTPTSSFAVSGGIVTHC